MTSLKHTLLATFLVISTGCLAQTQATLRILKSDSTIEEYSDPKVIHVNQVLSMKTTVEAMRDPLMRIKFNARKSPKIEYKSSEILMMILENTEGYPSTVYKQIVMDVQGEPGYGILETLFINDSIEVFYHEASILIKKEGEKKYKPAGIGFGLVRVNGEKVEMSPEDQLTFINHHFGSCEAIKEYTSNSIQHLIVDKHKARSAFMRNCFDYKPF